MLQSSLALTQPHFASTETVPLDEIVPTSWRKAVVTQENAGKSEQVSRLVVSAKSGQILGRRVINQREE